MKNTNFVKRSSALLLALILAAGVCLCISSCEEAEDTSSTKTESDASSYVPKGRGIILNSQVGEMWNDIFVTEKYPIKCIVTTIDGSAVDGGSYFKDGREMPNIYEYDKEIKDLLLFTEDHIIGEARLHFRRVSVNSVQETPYIVQDTPHIAFTLLDYPLKDVKEGIDFSANPRMVTCSFYTDNTVEIEVAGVGGENYTRMAFKHNADCDEIESLLMKKFNRPIKRLPYYY